MSRAILDPAAADRLAKLCGMLGSAHDGERASFAAKADEFVRRLGLTWRDVIARPTAQPGHGTAQSGAPWRRRGMSNWQKMARYCAANRDILNPRDRDFVNNACGWHGEPTEKQAAWLCDVYSRVMRARSSTP